MHSVPDDYAPDEEATGLVVQVKRKVRRACAAYSSIPTISFVSPIEHLCRLRALADPVTRHAHLPCSLSMPRGLEHVVPGILPVSAHRYPQAHANMITAALNAPSDVASTKHARSCVPAGGLGAVLPEVPEAQARAGASLPGVPALRAAHGPPLPLDQQLRGARQLQGLPALPALCAPQSEVQGAESRLVQQLTGLYLCDRSSWRVEECDRGHHAWLRTCSCTACGGSGLRAPRMLRNGGRQSCRPQMVLAAAMQASHPWGPALAAVHARNDDQLAKRQSFFGCSSADSLCASTSLRTQQHVGRVRLR